ncbi:MAG TPA: phosphomannomutase/phosphoglucomutase [Patescibacteria group bacterium]|nr:phosphomannomutase/phosphoglucomutase [Patescibacteria group bacterium]
MINIASQIFKSYDIRGTYPDQIHEKNIVAIVNAIHAFFLEQAKKESISIVVGRDMRLSGPSLFAIVKKTLVDAGAQVIDIGLVATPTFYFTVQTYRYDAGIQLSASHNPPQYNGLKLVQNFGGRLLKIGKSTGMEKIKEYALAGKKASSSQKGTVTAKKNILTHEIEEVKKMVDFSGILPLKVVADPANAMGSLYIEELFKHLPCELVKMNFELDGSFPAHQPDPLVKANLKSLQQKVREERADIGLAPDGDGDRLFFVDEKGQIVSASYITALVARELLKKTPGAAILYDIRYTKTPAKNVKKYGGISHITKVGHAFITEAMHTHKALFAGESSGHYYFAKTGGAEWQLPVILIVLSVISKEKKPLSLVVEELRGSFESGEYNFKTDTAKEILAALQEKYCDGKMVTIDGVAVEYDTWRFGVRTSNTEPLIRLNLEADSEKLMEEKRDELINFITHAGATLMKEE